MKAEVKIPEDRVGALIGERRRELLRIERATKTKIKVEGNNALIEGEATDVWGARDIVRAVGRGFSPVRALSLMKGNALEIYDLSDIASEARVKVIESRIIGRKGRTRELLEELCKVRISIYGKTIAAIGSSESLALFREAVDMLIEGRSHRIVYAHLEKSQKQLALNRTSAEDAEV